MAAVAAGDRPCDDGVDSEAGKTEKDVEDDKVDFAEEDCIVVNDVSDWVDDKAKGPVEDGDAVLAGFVGAEEAELVVGSEADETVELGGLV
jgi:hypothetical protein